MIKPVGGPEDPYDISLLKVELKKSGYDFDFFPKTDSTMKIVEEHARKGVKSLIIALADHQTEGAGREGRKWLDTPGSSLMFSGLFQIPQSTVAIFADMVSLAICQVLRQETKLEKIKIKYPNDLVFEDKKLGGILVKNIYDDKLNYLGTNLGVGLNTHYGLEELKTFPTDYPATSLDVCTGSFVNRQNLLLKITGALRYLNTEAQVIEANANARESFDVKWKDLSSIYGRKIAILKDDKIVDSGLVINTGIGKGVELETKKGRKWISLFETDMKARVLRN